MLSSVWLINSQSLCKVWIKGYRKPYTELITESTTIYALYDHKPKAACTFIDHEKNRPAKFQWQTIWLFCLKQHVPSIGQVTLKWLIRTGPKSNSSEILCLFWISANLNNFSSKRKALLRRHITSKWRRTDVDATSLRHFDVMCPLGMSETTFSPLIVYGACLLPW